MKIVAVPSVEVVVIFALPIGLNIQHPLNFFGEDQHYA